MGDLSKQKALENALELTEERNVLLGHFVPIQNMDIQNMFVKVHLCEWSKNQKKNTQFKFVIIKKLIANMFTK